MMFGELEAFQVLLGNSILLLNQVDFLLMRIYLETSITVSAMCLTCLCVVPYCSKRIEAQDLSWQCEQIRRS